MFFMLPHFKVVQQVVEAGAWVSAAPNGHFRRQGILGALANFLEALPLVRNPWKKKSQALQWNAMRAPKIEATKVDRVDIDNGAGLQRSRVDEAIEVRRNRPLPASKAEYVLSLAALKVDRRVRGKVDGIRLACGADW
jgi:hypothetical protein